MSNKIRQLALISRSEFLMPNLGSLIMGLAWGVNPPIDLTQLVILTLLSFVIINLSSAIGAQANTISDYELDFKDPRKKELVQALDNFGHIKIKIVLITELVIASLLAAVFSYTQKVMLSCTLVVMLMTLPVLKATPP